MLRHILSPLSLLLVCSPLLAQDAGTISGTIYLDPPALAVRGQFVPTSAVVKLYREDGTPVATMTAQDGRYRFTSLAAGNYWVAVDSKSIRSTAAPNAHVWAEQTFGPAGAVCAQTNGSTRTNFFEGACAGGRSLASDDASSFATSEHVARVASGSVGADFAFSFNIVTSIEDSTTAPIQGSLRQFIENANALTGPNAMRFVPLARAVQAQQASGLGLPQRWWTMTMKGTLPAITDAGTTIDGEAHNILSTASVVDVNEGRIDEPAYLRTGDRRNDPREEKPELEVVAAGSEGFVCDASCEIRGLALHGVANSIVTRADARIEQVVVGAHADIEDGPRAGNVGIQIERGTTTLRFVYIVQQQTAGVAVAASGARIDADYLQIMRCGEPASGAGIVILSDGSTVRHSRISANYGAGAVIGSPEGTHVANGNVLEDSIISNNLAGIVLTPGSSRNTFARNQITWNRVGGITASPYGANPPQANRISANIFDENGGRPIALNAEEKRDMLATATGTCGRVDTVANHGINAPVVSTAERSSDKSMVTITGRGCPGQTIELYRSYVTSDIRKAKDNSRLIRKTKTGETITIDQQQLDAYPSIGEFNYVVTTVIAADGTFSVTVPLETVVRTGRATTSDDVIITNEEALHGNESDRAYSAIAIDAEGNTSEMSERRRVHVSG